MLSQLQECCWHLVGRGQGAAEHLAGQSPPPRPTHTLKNNPAPNANSAEVEKPTREHPKAGLPNPEAGLSLGSGFGRSRCRSADMRPVRLSGRVGGGLTHLVASLALL